MSRLIRILHFSPSTATQRHDGYRASLGIVGFLQEELMTFRLAHRCELIWALPAINSREQVHALLSGGDLIVVGTPTYGQGSPWFVRKFFELSTGCSIWGKPATAFATSGGEHTGGEVAVGDTLRSLQGMGACTFSFAQKTLVFGTNQKFLADGHFDLIDIWFMRQFARTVLLHAITRDNPDDASAWAARLGLETDYYNRFPGEAQLQNTLGHIQSQLNAPLVSANAGYAALSATMNMDCFPPNASYLPFANLLPEPFPHVVTFS
jgi:multimeric flavodoxin WrbA